MLFYQRAFNKMAQINLPENIVQSDCASGESSDLGNANGDARIMEVSDEGTRKMKRKSRRNNDALLKSQSQHESAAILDDQLLNASDLSQIGQNHESNVSESESNIGLSSTEKDTGPVITITFCDPGTFDLYRDPFRKFLQSFREFSLAIDDTTMKIFDSGRKQHSKDSRSEDECGDNISEVESETSGRKRKRKRKKMDNPDDKLFVLDTKPANEGEKFPLYKSTYLVEDKDAATPVDGVRRIKPCFNCGELHDFKDCPVPKDFNRINMTRAKLWGGKATRYHVNAGNKNGAFQPGVISERLRKALGLGRHQIPAHVYKMRNFGYPPGWLDEAKVVQSDIALYDGEGKRDQTSKTPQKATLNSNMIIDYPGFNCSPGKGYRDEYLEHGVPPFTTALCKENMIAFVNKSLEHEAMLKHSLRPKSPSPSLLDLEAQKKKLLEQLTTDEDSNTSNTQSNELNQAENANKEEGSKSLPTTPNTPKTPGGSVSRSLTGTPILKSLSPYSRLPKTDNFSKNISPMSLQATSQNSGKYEKISVVLEKVRSKIKNQVRDST